MDDDGPRLVAVEQLLRRIAYQQRLWWGLAGRPGGGSASDTSGPGGGGVGGGGPGGPGGGSWGGGWGGGFGGFGGYAGGLILDQIRSPSVDVVGLDPFGWDPFAPDIIGGPWGKRKPPAPPPPPPPTGTLVAVLHGIAHGSPLTTECSGVSVVVKDHGTGGTLGTTDTDSAGRIYAAIGTSTDLDVTVSLPDGYYGGTTGPFGSSYTYEVGGGGGPAIGGDIYMNWWKGPYWCDGSSDRPVSLVGKTITYASGSSTIANNEQTSGNMDGTVTVASFSPDGGMTWYYWGLTEILGGGGAAGPPFLSLSGGGNYWAGTTTAYSLSGGTGTFSFSGPGWLIGGGTDPCTVTIS